MSRSRFYSPDGHWSMGSGPAFIERPSEKTTRSSEKTTPSLALAKDGTHSFVPINGYGLLLPSLESLTINDTGTWCAYASTERRKEDTKRVKHVRDLRGLKKGKVSRTRSNEAGAGMRKQGTRQKRALDKFDATLGYPGEGPIKRPLAEFDSTLGYPGEGPTGSLGAIHPEHILVESADVFAIHPDNEVKVENDLKVDDVGVEHVPLHATAAAYRAGIAEGVALGAAAGVGQLNVKGQKNVHLANKGKGGRLHGKIAKLQQLVMPGKETIKCRNCTLMGHYSSDCPNPETAASAAARLKREKRILDQMAAVPVNGAVAIQMEDADVPAGAPPVAPSPPPPPGGGGPPVLTAAEKAAKKAADDDALAENVKNDLYDKATGAWLTKDPSSVVDRKVVVQSLVQILRKDKYWAARPGLGHVLCMEVHERALRDAIAVRASTALSLTYSTYAGFYEVPDPPFAHGKYSFNGLVVRFGTRFRAFRRYLLLEDLFHVQGTVLQELARNENITPLSRDRLVYPILMVLALFLRSVVVPLCEELVKRFHYTLTLPSSVFNWPSFIGSYTMDFEAGNLGWVELIPCLFLAYREMVINGHDGRLLCFVEVAARFFMHAWFAWLPFNRGFVLHVLWNLVALALHILCNTSLSWRLDAFSWTQSFKSVIWEDVCLSGHYIKPIKVDERFTYKPGDSTCDPKFGCRSHWGIANIVPTLYRSCSCNERVSIEGRVGKLVPAAHVEPAVNSHWKAAIKRVRHAFKHVKPVQHPMPFEQWSSTFPPAKRDRFRKMKTEGFSTPLLRAKSFIKKEIALKDSQQAVPSLKDPRFIQGCEEELSCIVGPWIRPLTKHFKKGLKPRNFTPSEIFDGRQVIYMCGDNAQAVGNSFKKSIDLLSSMMDDDDSIVFIEDDQSRFDLHIRKGAFDAVHSVYKGLIPERIRRFLLRKVSRGTTSTGSKYSIPYTMQSGWPDTSLTDTVTNAMMKYSIHGVGGLWISIVMGDDSVTVTTRKSLAALGGESELLKQYEAFGMEIELAVKFFALDVEMCSSRFFPVGDSFVLMPKPGKILAKSLTDAVNRTLPGQKQWLQGIATGLEYSGKVDHVFGALAVGIRNVVGEGEGLIVADDYKIRVLKGVKSSSFLDVCIYYDHHYGFNERQVLDCMYELSRIEFGSFSDNSLLVAVARHDAL